jgi:HAD superfamily hydrolase (TIGR01509 family)
MNKLIIFDFDGVLVDTEYATFLYYKDVMPQYGFTLKEEDFKYKTGRKSIDFFKSVMGDRFDEKLADRLTQQKRRDFLKNITNYVTPIRGAFDLVKACKAEGLTLAVGSQNERPMLDAVLDTFQLKPYFVLIRSLQDLTNKKPHPEIFLGIAQQLQISPKEAVVIEDSADGVEAAKNGGFKVVGIATSDKNLNVDLLVNTPAELTAEQLKNL